MKQTESVLRRTVTEWEFEGGSIDRGGEPFGLDVIWLKEQRNGVDYNYYTPVIVAPGTDDKPFIIRIKPAIWRLATFGTCPKGEPGFPELHGFLTNGEQSNDLRVEPIAAPYFHNKTAQSGLYMNPEPLVFRVELNVRQADGSLRNNGIFGMPQREFEV